MGENMKKIILVGGGGHALSVLEVTPNHDIFLGYCDCKETPVMPIKYLGTDEEALSKYSPEEYDILHAVVYTSEVNLDLRSKLINKFKDYKGATIIADTAVVTPNSRIAEGTVVLHKAVVNHANIGKHCIVNTGVIVEHSVAIGDNVFLGTSAVVCGDAKIGNSVFIGAGSIIRDGVSICDNTIIGMGAIVTENITKSGIYVGTPAKLR